MVEQFNVEVKNGHLSKDPLQLKLFQIVAQAGAIPESAMVVVHEVTQLEVVGNIHRGMDVRREILRPSIENVEDGQATNTTTLTSKTLTKRTTSTLTAKAKQNETSRSDPKEKTKRPSRNEAKRLKRALMNSNMVNQAEKKQESKP